MRIFLIVLLLMCPGFYVFSNSKTDSLISVLKTELTKANVYDGPKEVRINALKKQLAATPQGNYNTRYTICTKLYEEYKVYQFDSAYVYTQKLFSLSQLSKDAAKLADSRIKLGFILLSAGMFKETFDCLNLINTSQLSDEAKIAYYIIIARSYSDLANYNSDKNYAVFDKSQSVKYLDSVIRLAKPSSYDRLINQGIRQSVTGQMDAPSPYYGQLLNDKSLSEHQQAMVATGASAFYRKPSEIDTRTDLLAIGAINDIRSSTKETLAIFELGKLLNEEGNTGDAYIFIQKAMDDAQYYGARLRTIKIGAVLPEVAAKKILTTEKEKDRFLIYLLSIGAITILVTLISFIVFNQLKRLRAKEKIIEEKNIQLEKINDKLIEEARIKEEYIGYFFNVISGYILKLEKLKRNVERKIVTKKYDEALAQVNEIDIQKERETLFYTFDHVFLKIFPNFITVFNSLLSKNDQIWPKDHEVLNTDLRIFALMRLGISDIETIANILEYSVKTIYVYKMRIKAKALVSSEQFDQKIMAIKSVDVLNKP